MNVAVRREILGAAPDFDVVVGMAIAVGKSVACAENMPAESRLSTVAQEKTWLRVEERGYTTVKYFVAVCSARKDWVRLDRIGVWSDKMGYNCHSYFGFAA